MNKIKLILINGPLGSGKTTVLRNILSNQAFANARVIENEYANYSVDTAALHTHAAESRVTTIAGVCICCSTEDELINALVSLSTEISPVIIEATGVANSVQLLEKIIIKPIFEKYDLSHMIFVVDAAEYISDIVGYNERHNSELYLADSVIVTKLDLVPNITLEEIKGTLHRSAGTQVIEASEGTFDVSSVAGPGTALERLVKIVDASPHATLPSYSVIALDGLTVSPKSLETFWEQVHRSFGIARMKGDCMISGKIMHIEATTSQLRISPSNESVSQKLVFIGPAANKITGEYFRSFITAKGTVRHE